MDDRSRLPVLGKEIYKMLDTLDPALKLARGNDMVALTSLVLKLSDKVLDQEKDIAKLKQDVYDTEGRCKKREKVFHQQLVEKQQVIDEQAAKIASLADRLETGAHVRTQVVGNTQGKGEQTLSYAQAAAQDQLRQLQSKVDTLTSRQVCLEKEKEREKRNKNVLFGNVREGESPIETREKVVEVIRDVLKADCKPIEARPVGKQVQGKSRLIWVKLKSEEDKLQLLRQAKVFLLSVTLRLLLLVNRMVMDKLDQHNAQAHPLETAAAIATMSEEALQQHVLDNDPSNSTDATVTISPPLGISPPLSPTVGTQ